ncbi:MAG: hypothetical protein RLZZ198_1144 [Bacteroidota bacterium]|jgi:hypothetical protein
MEKTTHDFNAFRPHCSLNGSTPDEAYSIGKIMPKNQFQTQFIQARTNRINENKNNACLKCS